MKRESYLKYIIFVLIMMILVLVGYIIYTDNLFGIKDIISPSKDVKEAKSTEVVSDDNNQNNCLTDVDEVSIDFDELSKISKGDYAFVNGEYNNEYSINALSDGKVNINFTNNISNISNAKGIILFSGPSAIVMSYILTEDGYIYKYDLSNVSKNNFEATKVDEYSNIKQMVRYRTRKANAGGCDFVVLIDDNNKYYSLDSYCF